MNDNIVPFPLLFEELSDQEYNEMLIWQCNCSSTEFYYHIINGLECVSCGTFQEGHEDDV